MGNDSWRNLFQDKAAVNLISWSSDHNPIMLEVLEKGEEERGAKKTSHRCRYEDMWSSYERCKEIIKNEWEEGSCWSSCNPAEMFRKISKVSLARLKNWSREEFGGRKRKLEELINKLNELKSNCSHLKSGKEVRIIENQIDNILVDDEIF